MGLVMDGEIDSAEKLFNLLRIYGFKEDSDKVNQIYDDMLKPIPVIKEDKDICQRGWTDIYHMNKGIYKYHQQFELEVSL